MPEQIEACPDCDSAKLEVRNRGSMDTGTRGDKLRCQQCGARFSDPVVRNRRGSHNPGGLRAKLLDADPEEVSSDA